MSDNPITVEELDEVVVFEFTEQDIRIEKLTQTARSLLRRVAALEAELFGED